MAEVQTTTQSGELTQRFIEFVMMQAQNAALFLGQIPNPQTGQGEVNLELARMFIDQLAMIQEKTRGNLSNEEAGVLRNALANLQMAFVEVSQAEGGRIPAADAPEPPEAVTVNEPPQGDAASSQPAEMPPAGQSSPAEGESRKKFTKSYGA
ncbi:MAG: DUF1844 domain-containing protein [Chthoniobacterales bacterium]|nr:DUF1844 domain-containing protein [Chthoniobacterales bacterium]